MADPVPKVSSLSKKEVFALKANGEDFAFEKSVRALEMSVEWLSLKGGFCDLDVLLYLYDENARFIEKLNFDKPLSKDEGFELLADLDNTKESKTHEEQVRINFSNVAPNTSSAIVFIDGGPRNFQSASTITIRVTRKFIHNDGASNFSASLDNIAAADDQATLFETCCVPRKDYQAILALVLHKTGFHPDGSAAWSCKAVFEPVMVSRSKEKDDVCDKAIVNLVPLLYQYRPRLFPSVQAICAQLSSTALPNLKKLFMASSDGLPINSFTEVIFMQLFEANSGLLNPAEAEYTVAMLHELFGQIDYNGDGFVDWDEFTTFCIYTGLITETSKPPTDGSAGGLDNYVIEYSDDKNLKDTTNASYASLALMRHVACTKKVIVLPDTCDVVNIMNERLGLFAKIYPKKFIEKDCDKSDAEKLKIMDVVYIPCKDLYCYSASDHSLVFCKELQGHAGKKEVTFNIYNRINHTFLHVKLCWSDASKILCSVNVENTIFGWEIDSTAPLFQISRHSQKITDFIALDSYGLFATCSLDKRIKLWSQTTRRMKGVLVGHKRGIRFLSHGKDCLLSAGFECEAKAWDLDLFEQTLTLRGHRKSISACKVMCRSEEEDELRGLTVDESGEFRLWDLFVKKGSDSTYATTLQTFNSKDETLSRVNFLAIPFDKEFSNGEYSNIIAGTYALMHFRPEKSVQEFVPPACMIYSETNCCLLSACGKNLLKYDIITGSYQNSFPNIGNSDISCLCMDGTLGRRVFVGFANGYVYMINFATGQILSTVLAFSTAVSSLCLMKSECGNEDILYSGSNDGTIRMISETNGDLGITSTLEHAMGDHSAVGTIIALEHANVIVATSIARCWGIWHKQTLKKAFLVQEDEPISGIVVIGGGGQSAQPRRDFLSALEESKRLVITVALCISDCVRIYSVNLQNLKDVEGCMTHKLRANGVYFSDIVRMSYPQTVSLNYKVTNSKSTLKDVLVASTDMGKLLVWDIENVLKESVHTFYDNNPNLINLLKREFADSIPSGYSPAQSPHQRTGPALDGSLHRICEESDNDDAASFLSSDMDTDTDGDDDNCSLNSEESDQTQTSLFSLTSTMGTIKDVVQPDLERASSIGMTSIKIAQTAKVTPESTLKGLENMRKLRRMTTINIKLTNNLNVKMGGENLICIDPVISWTAHSDTIVNLQILGDSGCFATISLDGFHRVWNLQQDCLGLLSLPNLTEEMKQKAEEEKVEWLFLKEKIPVKPVHTTLANRFLKTIAERDQPKIEVQRRTAVQVVDENKDKIKFEISTNDEGRNNILMSLLGSYRDYPKKVLPKVSSQAMLLRIASETLAKTTDELSKSVELLPPLPDTPTSKATVAEKRLQKVNQEIDALKCKLNRRTYSPKRSRRDDKSVTTKNSDQDDSASCSTKRSSCSAKTIKSLFISDKEWNNPNDFVKHPVNAFSTSSIDDGYKDGVIDDESHKMLRILNKDEFRTKAFDRVIPGVMLRNVAMSTTFQFPTSEINHAEMSFGMQKGMYKHANNVIKEKNKISSVSSQMNARHGIALKRLKQNVTKVGQMTQQAESTYNVDISLPSISLNDEDDEESNSGQTQPKDSSIRSRVENASALQEQGEKRMPDAEKIEKIMKKVMEAENDSIPEWELASNRKRDLRLKKSARRRRTDNAQHSQRTIVALERKLALAIKRRHSDEGDGNDESSTQKVVLRPRDLVPNYKLADVRNFLDGFFRVDKNLSGLLDVDEWVEFFLTMNKSMTAQAARQLFSHVDTNRDGVLSLHELVPVIFSEATSSQVSLILKYIDEEVTRNMKTYRKDEIYKEDMAILFETYDADNIGYIKVQLVRDKLAQFRLPVAAQLAFTQKLKDMEDGDMVNLPEFTRMFISYMSYRNEENDDDD